MGCLHRRKQIPPKHDYYGVEVVCLTTSVWANDNGYRAVRHEFSAVEKGPHVLDRNSYDEHFVSYYFRAPEVRKKRPTLTIFIDSTNALNTAFAESL